MGSSAHVHHTPTSKTLQQKNLTKVTIHIWTAGSSTEEVFD